MKKYNKYKHSDIDWIGQIPEHWEKYRLKILTEKVINGIWGENPKNDKNDLYCIRVADFNYAKLQVSDKLLTIRNIPEKQREGRLLYKNDVLIEKSGGGEKQPVGRAVNYSLDSPAVCSNFIAKIKLKKCLAQERYFVYLLKTLYDFGINKMFIKQTTGIQNLDLEEFLNFSFFIPSFHEQTAIANYLDKKTAQIDELIADKKRLLELYEEEKTAIINQAVTKGVNVLNYDVNDEQENYETKNQSPSKNQKNHSARPLKHSGIEWLGEIPEHWEVKKLSYCFETIGSGTTPKSNNPDYYNGDFYWLQTGDLNDGIIDKTSKTITQKALDDYTTLRFYPIDSVVIAMYGATIGRIGLLKIETTTNQACCALANPKNVNSKFVFYWFLSIRQEIISLSYGGGQPNINQEQIKNLKIQVPPLEEQQQIVNYIEKEINRINTKTENAQKLIDLLEEYKQALISEVVTGKIKVTE